MPKWLLLRYGPDKVGLMKTRDNLNLSQLQNVYNADTDEYLSLVEVDEQTAMREFELINNSESKQAKSIISKLFGGK